MVHVALYAASLPASVGSTPSSLGLRASVGLLSALAVAFLVLPLAVLCLNTFAHRHVFGSEHFSGYVAAALQLSLMSSSIATLIVIALGGALALFLARNDFPGKAAIDTLIDLPMVLPPMVSGLALLLVFGRNGSIGSFLQGYGIRLTFTTTAVVLAQVFISLPFFVRAARSAFESVDPKLERASLLLGASRGRTFFKVTLPLVWPMLLAGVVLAWARCLGEFGATIVVAGNFEGVTQTMPLAIFGALQSDIHIAVMLSVILLVTSFTIVMLLKMLLGNKGGMHA
jgi:molybdate transport system permease protein